MDVSISKKPGDDLGSFPMIFGSTPKFLRKKKHHIILGSHPLSDLSDLPKGVEVP